MWDCSSGFVDPQTGRVLQVDASFFRAYDSSAISNPNQGRMRLL
jgi:hypothetical protein